VDQDLEAGEGKVVRTIHSADVGGPRGSNGGQTLDAGSPLKAVSRPVQVGSGYR